MVTLIYITQKTNIPYLYAELLRGQNEKLPRSLVTSDEKSFRIAWAQFQKHEKNWHNS